MRVFLKGTQAQLVNGKLTPLTSGSQNYYKAQFVFTHDWDKFTKTAMFFNNRAIGARYTAPLTQVELSYSEFPHYQVWECVIPNDALQSKGSLYAGVVGVIGSGDNAVMVNSTTVFTDIQLGVSDLTILQNPAPDVYQQLLEELAEIQRNEQANWDETDVASIQYILNKDSVEDAITWNVLDEEEPEGE